MGAVPWARPGRIPQPVAIPRAVCFVLVDAERRAVRSGYVPTGGVKVELAACVGVN
jgi:hypothetical protein